MSKSKPPPKPFIPAWLDDLGLDCYEFRVLCRVLRRGTCYESLTKMAKALKARRQRIQSAINHLCDDGWLIKEKRFGTTSIVRLNLGQFRTRFGVEPRPESDYPVGQKRTRDLVQVSDCKGVTRKGKPIKERTASGAGASPVGDAGTGQRDGWEEVL